MILTCTSKKSEAPDVITWAFSAPGPISWQAGQFLEYTLHHQDADNRGERRWFTNSAAPHENEIHITTRISKPSSTFKQALLAMQAGDTIEAKPPEGDFIVNNPEEQRVFIAGGIGITPFRSIMADLHYRNEPLNITLLYANRSADSIVFHEELSSLAKVHPEMDIQYIFNPQTITERVIRDAVPIIEEPYFYISGPEPMVESIGELLVKMGVPKDHIKQDFFPNYTVAL